MGWKKHQANDKSCRQNLYFCIMSSKIEIKTLILHYILKQSANGHHPNSGEILAYLINSDYPVNIRTVQRRLLELLAEDHIDIDAHNGYFLDEEHNEFIMSPRDRLERSLAYESIWSEKNHYHPDGHPIIAFEAYNSFRGAENIRDLIYGIRNNRILQFHYTNYYQAGADSDRKVYPLFLKEYLNRWYLMAWDLAKDEQRLFGIDRINNLQISTEQFKPKAYYEKTWSHFHNIVGLRYSDGANLYDPMNLVIRCEDIQIYFLDSLPLHHSQEKIPAPNGQKGQTRYRYHVAPNFELEQRLLSMSHLIEVEEPIWYREEFKAKLKDLLKKYN